MLAKTNSAPLDRWAVVMEEPDLAEVFADSETGCPGAPDSAAWLRFTAQKH
jgi:hypothetical protein